MSGNDQEAAAEQRHDADVIKIFPLGNDRLTSDQRQSLKGLCPFPKLIWVSRGSCRCVVDGISRSLGANSLIYLPKGTPMSFQFGQGSFGTHVCFGAQDISSFPHNATILRLMSIPVQSNAANLMEQINRENTAGDNFGQKAIAHLLGLMGVFLSRQEPAFGDHAASRSSAKLMRRFSMLVENNLKSGLSVAEYAALLDVTATHLSRVCTEMNGQSASKFLQDRIVHEARLKLSAENKTISKIAQDLGFASAAYFSRFFSAQVGQSPRAFRARYSSSLKNQPA